MDTANTEYSETARQYLVFNLADEFFGLEIIHIQEVLEFSTLTKVPRMPEFVCGVINLRGRVAPVIDLRLKFGLPASKRTVNTCIIIVEVEFAGEKSILGAMVDSVQEVLTMDGSQIEPPPRMGNNVDISFIRGIGKHDDQFILILDINRVFSTDDLLAIQEVDMSGRPQPTPAQATAPGVALAI